MSPDYEPAQDARRVRFERIDGLQRRDIGLAGEIWLRDICEAKWSTRESMKLAAHLVRYMATPDPYQLALSRIEHQVQLTRDEIQLAMRTLRLYGAVELFAITGDELSAALNLSVMQRLAVLEARYRLEYLTRHFTRTGALVTGASRWTPPAAVEEIAEFPDMQRSADSAA